MKKKCIIGALFMCLIVWMPAFPVQSETTGEQVSEESSDTAVDVVSPSVLLMELNSGQVIYEKDADTPRRPASVTKLMTMLLAFDALDAGQLNLSDEITVSEHAAGMGGSQVYLEPGEVQTLSDLLKCMIVSSANDAAVAVAEAVAGSETAFVQQMNAKAEALSMTGTHFENACGLEEDGHLMSARDIAILSRTLLLTHPEVTEYTTIWMDSITHHTDRGDSEFGLANTNKFLKKYEGANGLKTGYTSAAGFSMSATATRDRTTLIAVVMGSETKDIRYADAAALLDYGFSQCSTYEDAQVLDANTKIDLTDGVKDQLSISAKSSFYYVFTGNGSNADISKEMIIEKNAAPVQKGETVGKMVYKIGEETVGSVDLIANESVEKQKYHHVLKEMLERYMNLF